MPKIREMLSDFFYGSPEKKENVSTLRPEQEQLFTQLMSALGGQGAGGAFGNVADYYRNLLSDNPEDLSAMAAPEMRRFHQDIIPGLSEQFAGMGAGGLSSSGFRNAATQAGTDLSERIAQMRANLRQSGVQGLQGLAGQGLGNYSQFITTRPGSPGFLSGLGNIAGKAGANYLSSGFSGLFGGDE